MTTPSSERTGNGLALLANKCASRTFDISSGMVYASMRDQIVRAQLLIRDLKRCDPSCDRVLIVGAGVAGIVAAVCARSLGLETLVVESNSTAFQLQTGVHRRMVGPFMYEWPSILSTAQSYPPVANLLGQAIDVTPTWDAAHPISAHDFAERLFAWYISLSLIHPPLQVIYNCDRKKIRDYVQEFVNVHSRLTSAGSKSNSPATPFPENPSFKPDYVILAVGTGTERVHLIDGTEDDAKSVKGEPFWKDDDLRNEPKMEWNVGVFGGGDGALQDVLRLITKFDHPLLFIEQLKKGKGNIAKQINDLMPALETLEQQSRLYATWSAGSIYDLIDAECERICTTLAARPGVIVKVCEQIREGDGTVRLVHRGDHFGKAYLLNRFCLHLIEKCLPPGRLPGKITYQRLQNMSASTAFTDSAGVHIVELSNGEMLRLDKVVVRFGPSQDELRQRQLVKLHPDTQADRTSMASIPLPFTVAE